jgi:hypothetical protein
MDSEFDLMKWLFAPIVPFISHPERIAVVAALFIVAAALLTLRRRKIAWPLIVAGVAWALFAAWEQHCVQMGYSIRVDLMLIYPLLLATTLFGLAGIFVSNPQQFTIRRQFSLRALMIVSTLIALALGAIMWLAS